MKKTLLLLSLILTIAVSEDISAQDSQNTYLRKKSFFVTWGYNRAHYNDTDIRFHGDDFDFTLKDVSAHDIPLAFEARTYLNPLRFTIPQFDFRVGYFIGQNTSLSAGWDHMKYRVTQFQRVTIDGEISANFSEEHAGTYSDRPFDLKPSFIQMEHTNGLNFVRLAIEQHQEMWSNKQDFLHLDILFGASVGPVFTWTDSHVNTIGYKNWIHLAGWGTSGQLAARLRFRNFFYVQYQHQTGYLNLPDIIFMDGSSNRASHDIRFNEQSITIGAQIPLFIGGNPNKVELN